MELLGLVTKRDTDFVDMSADAPVSSIMTLVGDLVCAREGVDLKSAYDTLQACKGQAAHPVGGREACGAHRAHGSQEERGVPEGDEGSRRQPGGRCIGGNEAR